MSSDTSKVKLGLGARGAMMGILTGCFIAFYLFILFKDLELIDRGLLWATSLFTVSAWLIGRIEPGNLIAGVIIGLICSFFAILAVGALFLGAPWFSWLLAIVVPIAVVWMMSSE